MSVQIRAEKDREIKCRSPFKQNFKFPQGMRFFYFMKHRTGIVLLNFAEAIVQPPLMKMPPKQKKMRKEMYRNEKDLFQMSQ